MQKEVDETLRHQHPLDGLELGREPELSFKSNWIQEKENHLCVLETFWNYVRAEESLVFVYAKTGAFHRRDGATRLGRGGPGQKNRAAH